MSLDKFRRALRIKGPLTLESAGTARGDAQVYLTEVTTTLVAVQSGKTHIATKASATQDFILPLASAGAGLSYTFIAGHASGEITVQVAGSDTVACVADPSTTPNVSVVTSAGDGIVNTGASNVLNDQVTLVSDGVSRWYAVAQKGIWASE